MTKNNVKGHEQNETQTVTSFWKRMKLKTLWICVGSLLVAVGVTLSGYEYVAAHQQPYYMVYLNGQEIGALQNKEQLTAAYREKEAALAKKYPSAHMVVNTKGVTATLEHSFNAEVNTNETQDKLQEALPYYAEGVSIQVDGKVIGIVKDEATVQAVLAQVADQVSGGHAQYATGSSQNQLTKLSAAVPKVESANFLQKVEQVPFTGDASKVVSPEEVAKRLLDLKEQPITYEVKDGDTISSIAKAFGVKAKDIWNMNPGLSETKMQIGTKLMIKQPKAPLSVRTVERSSVPVMTKPAVEIRKSSEVAVGKTFVKSYGEPGTKVENYRVIKVDGRIVSREWLGQTVTKPSSPKIVVQGTKKIAPPPKVAKVSKVKATRRAFAGAGESLGGMFAWPLSSPQITSQYGMRWGKLHKGIDMVSSNHNIHAAASGTVTFAGFKTGYGNCIIIRHADGYETLYGHMSKLLAHSGEKVSQGESIGIMGSTGHSTGPHLHFEIHHDGSLLSPLQYL